MFERGGELGSVGGLVDRRESKEGRDADDRQRVSHAALAAAKVGRSAQYGRRNVQGFLQVGKAEPLGVVRRVVDKRVGELDVLVGRELVLPVHGVLPAVGLGGVVEQTDPVNSTGPGADS